MVLVTASRRAAAATSVAVFAVVFVVHAAVGLYIGVHGWDDGSITLAFARTFADSGRIALTPFSEVVEGFSSPFWFLLSAVTDLVVPLDFAGMVYASQLWAGFFAGIGALLLFRLLPMPTLPAGVVSVLVFCYGPFLNETVNGMEMTALSALALAVVWLLRSDDPRAPMWLALAGAVAPWIRWESAGYVAGAALVILFLARDRRRARALLVGAVASLVVLTALRLAIFDSLLPNTMYAKQSPPYQLGWTIERLAGTKTVLKELLLVAVPGVALLVLALVRPLVRPQPLIGRAVGLVRRRRVDTAVAFAVGYVACVAAFNLIIGPNWGYLGRMEQSLIAIIVLAVVMSVPADWSTFGSPSQLGVLAVVLLALTYYGLDKVRFAERADPNAQIAITPDEYRQTGETLESVRARLGLAVLRVMTPDVGGTSLCCPALAIDDLGLLSNARVAHEGWGALPAYFSDAAPDVVVTHSVWSQASRLYEIDYFRREYTPVVVRGMWFYLRNDHLATLKPECSFVPAGAVSTAWYRGADVDEDYVRSLGLAQVCRLG